MSCHLRYTSSILRQVDGHEFECAGAIGNDYQVVDDGFNGDAIIYRTSVLTLQIFCVRKKRKLVFERLPKDGTKNVQRNGTVFYG